MAPPGWRPGQILLGIWATAVLAAAIFPLDGGPVPASGQIHSAVSALAFPAITAASPTLTHTFTGTPRWPATGRVSRWTARLVLGSFLLAITTQHQGWSGVTQRMFLAAVLAWLITAANQLCPAGWPGRPDHGR